MVTRKHAASVALIVILPSLILTICAPSHAATCEVVASETVAFGRGRGTRPSPRCLPRGGSQRM